MRAEEIIDNVEQARAWLDAVDLRGRRTTSTVHRAITEARAAVEGALETLQDEVATTAVPA
jgi:hypothetical protein